MKKVFIPLLTVAVVVSIVFAGCVPAVEPAPPVTPPVTPPGAPVIPPPVTPPEVPTELPGWGPMKGLAVKPDGTPYYFAYSFCLLYNPWMAFTIGIFESYMTRAGAVYTAHDANVSIDKQMADLEDLLIRKPDGVLLQPVDGDAAVPAAEKLAQAGIPVFNYDVRVPTPTIVSSARVDNFDEGWAMGKYLVNYFEEKGIPGHAYELYGYLGSELSRQRSAGFHAALEGTNIEILTSAETFYAEEKACDFVMDTLPAHPEINAVFDHGVASGTYKGLEAIEKLYPVGHPLHIVHVTISLNSDTAEIMRDGYCDACAVECPWIQVDIEAKAMFTHVILGKPVPKEVILPTTVHTYETIVEEFESPTPTVWGIIIFRQIPYDALPVMDLPEIIVTPTRAMLE
ncbi:hypothetical protein ES703_78634 [subsurface metagenome]